MATTYDRTASPPGSIYVYSSPVTDTWGNDAILETTGDSLQIGARHGMSFLAGAIDDVRIYGWRLTADEVRQPHNLGKGRFLPAVHLLLK